jgi:hypothetical protein
VTENIRSLQKQLSVSERRALGSSLDAAAVRALVQSPSKQIGRYKRVAAMSVLAGGGVRNAHGPLKRVLLRKDESDSIRTAAAVFLTQLGGKRAEQALLEASALRLDIRLRVRVARGLGVVGSSASMDALARLARSRVLVIRNEAKFAQTLVAFREGLAGHRPRVPKSRPRQIRGRTAQSLKVLPVKDSERAALGAWLGERPYGVQLDTSLGRRIDCAGGHLMFLVNRDLSNLGPTFVERTRERAWIFGLLARGTRLGGDRYDVGQVMLCWPRGGGRVGMSVHRADGRMLQYGAIRVVGEQARISLGAVAESGAMPLSIRGTWRDGQLDFDCSLARKRPRSAVRRQTLAITRA